jgi:hypothetical protein
MANRGDGRTGKRRSRGRRIGFQLAETMAAVSQMALLSPSHMDAWMRREMVAANGDGRRREPRR